MTAAIELALRLCDVTEGDEVITSSYSCMATNSPIAILKARAIWVDLSPDSVFMDPSLFEASITSKTKAAIVYHVAGYPGYTQQLKAICDKHSIKLIEDCNASFLATSCGDYVGGVGDYSVYSFYPNRLVNGLEGAALRLKDLSDYKRVLRLRKYGIDNKDFRLGNGEINPDSDIRESSGLHTMSNLAAAVADHQLRTVHDRVSRQRQNADELDKYFSNLEQICSIKKNPTSNPSYWVYLARLKNIRKSEFIAEVGGLGVEISSLHFRNDKYSCFDVGTTQEALVNTSLNQDEIIAIPCGWWMDDESIQQVISSIGRALNKTTNRRR
jgi:perosamine synthetase